MPLHVSFVIVFLLLRFLRHILVSLADVLFCPRFRQKEFFSITPVLRNPYVKMSVISCQDRIIRIKILTYRHEERWKIDELYIQEYWLSRLPWFSSDCLKKIS